MTRANGSFVSSIPPNRLLVFNEIGSFVPPKNSFSVYFRALNSNVLSSFSTDLNSLEFNHLYSQTDYPASPAQSFPDHNLLWLPDSRWIPDPEISGLTDAPW